MSHAYPLATSAKTALRAATVAARTRYEAEDLAEGKAIAALETEWLTPPGDDISELLDLASKGPGHGFVQAYEDAVGNTVLAVTYWKLAAQSAAKPKPKPVAREEETDDLYFKQGRTKKRRKAKPVDPNQLALFSDLTDPPDA